MFTLEKAKKIINIIFEEYPSLKDEIITIKEGLEFSVNMFLGNDIEITNFNKENSFKKNIVSYARKYFDFKDQHIMFYDFEECFGFIHEVGHIYYNNLVAEESKNVAYSNYKNKVYNSYNQAFEEYRAIPTEHHADQFAVNIIKNRTADMYAIMNEKSLQDATDEYNFWSM